MEEYGYSKTQIQAHPQFMVRRSPSGGNGYPVDIVVFKDDQKTYLNQFMIVECRSPDRHSGITQLRIYMSMSSAQIGVWFNGREHAYVQKVLDEHGGVTYQPLPEIPKKGQSIGDIGKHKRCDLMPPPNLKNVFRDIRNHLVGMTTGITRDEPLAREIINILFCKIMDERYTNPDDIVTFRAGVGETAAVMQRISDLFETRVKREYSDVFDDTDKIGLDAESLFYVVGSLQNYCIAEADRDAVGDAFEVFIGPALRGSEGQFFTPRNVVKMIVDIIDPDTDELVLDPACGSGGFLIVAMENLWRQIDEDGRKKRWSEETVAFKKKDVATRQISGIDKDTVLSKVSKAYMALMGDGRGGIFCDNTLRAVEKWTTMTQDRIHLNESNVIITNPPFGSKIKVEGEDILSQFELARKWKQDKTSKKWHAENVLKKKSPPQILFIERCLQMLKDGGRMGIVLPESLFGSPSYGYIIEFLRGMGEIMGVVSMPEELFQPGTHAKTCVLFFKKTRSPRESYPIFMSIVKYCGHDSRGNKIKFDDVPKIHQQYVTAVQGNAIYESIGFVKDSDKLKNNILIPKYYDPQIVMELSELGKTHDLVTVGSLKKDGIISISTGTGVGKLSYGTGDIPFIRTSDLSNWEIKINPKHSVSEDIYNEYAAKCDMRENDILVVKDGTYLVGTCALVTKNDAKSLFQSHIYKIRVLDEKRMSPFLLLALLSSPIVKKQIAAKRFTQDIIDTLGKRIMEIVLPVPKDAEFMKRITAQIKVVIEERTRLRDVASAIPYRVQSLED